jgi:flagellar hook-associated protein 2
MGGGTNLDVSGIVGKLMAVEQKPLTALNVKENSAQAKISAFGKVKGALSTFQGSLQGLSNPSKFQANTATSSNPSVLTATAMTSASVGNHSIDVLNLAQAQRLATAGFSSTSSPIGSGTITFDFGSVAADGQFNTQAGKFRSTAFTDAKITQGVTPTTEGATILSTEAATLIPSADATGSIPSGMLTINGVEVGKIKLLDSDSPIHRAQNIAEAFDDAYVESGGNADTFTAKDGKIIIKSEDGGKSIKFGITDTAKDSTEAATKLATLMKQTGLSASQLGAPAYGNSSVEVESTAGMSVGDSIASESFPPGTTITKILDATHFETSAAIKSSQDGDKVELTVSSVSSSKSIAIDSSNNSLEGIRDAINAGKIGVTANIINDGGDEPNRLVLSSDEVGAKNNMRISVKGDTALSTLLTHDPAGTQKLSEIAAGKDASLMIDGIPVSKPSNLINDAIQGVTLTLLSPGKSTTLKIGRDTAAVKTSVEDFVKSYNEFKKTITDLTAYNEATKKGAPLQGDSAMRSLDSQVDSILNTPLGTPAGSFTTLSQIGISRQVDGSLALDSTKFNDALETKFNDVAGLFAAIGKTTDTLVNYKTTSADTLPGNYSISVLQQATQGGITGNQNLDLGLTTIDQGSSIKASIDGRSASVALTAGTYSGTELATMLQEAINNTSTFTSAGKGVTASIDQNGNLRILSNSYGDTSSFSLDDGAGTSITDLLGSSAKKSTGQNVSGTINGKAATGKGQLLTSDEGDSKGLQIQVTGGPLGTRGSVNYTKGYAHKLSDYVNSAMGNTGVLTGRMNGLSASIKSLSKERDTINARLSTVEQRYRQQYTKLDASLSGMKETSSYLAQQLSKM